MDAPDAVYVRSASRVDFDALEWGEPDVGEIDKLQEEMDAIIVWIEDTIGYYFSEGLQPGMDKRMTAIPVRREPEVRKAVRMAVEWEAYKQQPDQLEGILDIEEVQSFSAGSYSETRRGARNNASATGIGAQIHPWPDLNRLLLSIRAPYLSSTAEVPIVGVSDPRYRGGADIMHTQFGRPNWYSPYDMRDNGPIVEPYGAFSRVQPDGLVIAGGGSGYNVPPMDER